MATTRWKGGAAAVAQIDTVQVTAYHASTVYKLTVGTKTVQFQGGGTVNAVATGLAAAWNASAEPEIAEVTASAATDTVTLTGDTAGVPFTATSSVSGGTGTIGSVTSFTACTGPNFVSEAKNYSGGAVPSNGDDLYVEATAVSMLYGFSALSGVTLATLNIGASFTGEIGLPEANASSSGGSYVEYRSQYLTVGATACTIGAGEGQGSQRIKLDFGSVQTTLVVRGTGSSAESGIPALLWKGTHASNVVNATGGDTGVCLYGGEVATIATLRVGASDNGQDARVWCGPGLSLTTLSMQAGTVDLNSGCTTVAKTGGTLTAWAGAITTLTDNDGTTVIKGTGTITTLNVGTDATVDFSQDMRSVAVTNCNLFKDCTLDDRFGRVTWSNGFKTYQCTLKECNIDVGVNRTYTPS